LRSDALNGWQSWIESSGDDQLEVFKTMICDWLPGQIDAQWTMPWPEGSMPIKPD
jgi:hypothetical protein